MFHVKHFVGLERVLSMTKTITPPSLKLYFSPRVLTMMILGFPYGMMYYLAVPTLQMWLKDLNYTNTIIGCFAWVYSPSILKFALAPLVSGFKIPYLQKLGQRRSWLVVAHLCLMILLILIGFSDPGRHLFYTAFLAALLAMFAAIQDIIVDAYRIEILNHDQAGPGVSMLSFGYRMGALTASAGSLYAAELFGWQVSYCLMACFVVMGVLAALLNPEPKIPLPSDQGFWRNYVIEPFSELLSRPGWWYTFAFILLFSMSDAMINNMANPFFIEIGFSKPEIASVAKIFGTISTVLGGFVGGLLVVRFNIFRALFWAGSLHALSHLLLVMQAYAGHDIETLYGVIACEKLTAGINTTVFIVYLSRQCNLMYTALQYAILSSFWSFSTLTASISGWLVDHLNRHWPTFFMLTFWISIPGILMILKIKNYPLGNDGRLAK